VRDILATQIDLAADGLDYVRASELPGEHRSRRYREIVNAGGVPSEMVIDENRAHSGHEFRDETEGPHPVTELRAPTP
jgi:hypothetical protein